ncbi:uncharacterized protein LOC119771148 [Culex quinquefasciatus]|uniref:uncharacterized protein LOC119771148 n=1 Tax=Culex quinquefasciatus TaxID=7176 RepID=UPI0018E34AB8|nr:uncharacterized protein LOC119771148 [Culex quinquefasciatus]
MQTVSSLPYSLTFVLGVVVGVTLEDTLVEVFRRYTIPIQYHHSPLLIEHFSFDEETQRLQKDLIGRILTRVADAVLLVRFDVRGQASKNNLIFLDGSDDSLARFIHGWNRQRYDRGGYYCVVVYGSDGRVGGRELTRKILDAMWKLRMLYVVVLTADDRGMNPEMTTFWPYGRTHCGGVSPIVVNFNSKELIADRLANFFGCPLRVGTFENQPFIRLNWDRNGKTQLFGFEGLLVNVLAKKLNFSIEVVTPPGNDQWGYPRKGGKSTGLMKLMVDETVDFGISSLGYTEDRSAILLPGIQHYTSYVVFAVPSGRPYSSFEKLFLPFDEYSWLAVFVTLVVATAIILIINTQPISVKNFIYGHGIWGPLTNMINILFGGPLDKAPKGTFARTLVAMWLMFTLVIRTAYQGSLYKYLQVPKNFSAPLTMDALDKSGLHYHMIDLASEFFVDYPNVLARTHFLPHERPLSDWINKIGRGELVGVVLCLVDHVAYHNKQFPIDEFVWATKEYVVGFPMAAFYPMQTFLRETFDREIQLIDSSGLIQHWVGQSADYDFSHDRRGTAVTQALSFGNMLGAFQILGVLELGAVCMFLLELLAQKWHLLRRFVDWMEEDNPVRSAKIIIVRPSLIVLETVLATPKLEQPTPL